MKKALECRDCGSLQLVQNRGRCLPCLRVRRRQTQKGSRIQKREEINNLKRQPCMDCGISYPPYVMQFDHRDPLTKKFSIGEQVYNKSMSLLLAEVAKCDIVCANCHAERSWGGP
jgi:hypothetical protein